ncbi:hypothetical protein BSKO_13554 [Bryopsis sp. KO-2023]|nr:hypothetical protein BSKO_13554 [Bryopsis sp. KO-2023]
MGKNGRPLRRRPIVEESGKAALADGSNHVRRSARIGRKGSVGNELSKSTDGSSSSLRGVVAKRGTRVTTLQLRAKTREYEPLSRKRSSSLSTPRGGENKRNKVMQGCGYCQKLESAQRRMQVICADNDSLRKQLGSAQRRIHDLEGKLEIKHPKRNMMEEVETAKGIIREGLKSGDITKHDILLGKEVEAKKRKGIRRSVFIMALSGIREEVKAQESNKESEAERESTNRHDSRRIELGQWDGKSEPHNLLDEIDRALLGHIAFVVKKCDEADTEDVAIKPTYMSVKKIVSQGRENLMRCQRNTIRELIGEPAKRKYAESGPKASEIRTLLMQRYMAEDPPHDEFETDAMDESVGNDVKTVVRMLTALHVLGLPGGIVSDVKESAQKYYEFADYVANSDANVQAPVVVKETKSIVDTRKDSQMRLIYLKKLLPEIVAIAYQPRALKDRNRCTDIVISAGNRECEDLRSAPGDFPLLGWK